MKEEAEGGIDSFYLGKKEAKRQLNVFNHSIEEFRKTFLGYPCNENFHLENFFKWWEHSSLSKSPLNDVGNPYLSTNYSLNAHTFELTVIKYFAELFSVKQPWGYITSGGTEGNEQGLYMGREVLRKFGRPILYYSEDAHYSIGSMGRILDLDMKVIKTNEMGEMNYQDLKKQLNPSRPVLFNISVGTTFKGAIDRIEMIHPILKQKKIKHFFYHADAALFGGYLPFYPDETKPSLNFEEQPFDSIAVSGHKFFGSPTPFGIFLIKKKYTKALEGAYIQYIKSSNLTIPCSRNALDALIFWWSISITPREEYVKQSMMIIENAKYLLKQLHKRNYPAWLNPYSNTVFFRMPSNRLCKHWILATMNCPKLGPLAHIVIMQHATKKLLNQFLKDLDNDR